MPRAQSARTKVSANAIFNRLLSNGKASMSSNLARYILTLGFSDEDQAHMRELAERNQDGVLSAAEHEELMNFVQAGHLLALLHSKARKTLKQKKVS